MNAALPPLGFTALDGAGPFAAHLGQLYLRQQGNEAVLGLHAEEHHANASGTVHGGLLATLCDTAVGRAVRAESDEIAGAATVSLTIDYLAPTRPGTWLEARARVEKLGGRLAFADCSVSADGHEVVRARAVFSVLD